MDWKQDFKIWMLIAFIGAAVFGLSIAVGKSDGLTWNSIKGIESLSSTDFGTMNLPETGNVEFVAEVIDTPTPTLVMIEPTKQLSAPIVALIVGDSMVLEGFGPRMESRLAGYQGITIKRFGKYSTGLNRTDYYDWYAKTQELVIANKPNILIVEFGGNDGQNIMDYSVGKKYTQSQAEWDVVYKKRVFDYLTKFTPQVREFYWVGHPIPRTDEFNRKFSRMNAAYISECAKFPNCHYVNEWDRFAIKGKYSATVADDNGLVKTVKGGDGIHVNTHGGNIMADEVIKVIKEDVILVPK